LSANLKVAKATIENQGVQMMLDSGEIRHNEAPSSLDNAPLPPSAIDLDHLRRYTMGDKQLEAEVLQLFAGDLPGAIGALKAARTDREWWVAAHTLKGSARAVGAWRVASAAAAAEQTARVLDDPAAKAKAMAACDLAITDAISYIRSTVGAA
jgi:HPt (histidine-containing phosphotransfer) domain-containing protein